MSAQQQDHATLNVNHLPGVSRALKKSLKNTIGSTLESCYYCDFAKRQNHLLEFPGVHVGYPGLATRWELTGSDALIGSLLGSHPPHLLNVGFNQPYMFSVEFTPSSSA